MKNEHPVSLKKEVDMPDITRIFLCQLSYAIKRHKVLAENYSFIIGIEPRGISALCSCHLDTTLLTASGYQTQSFYEHDVSACRRIR